MRLLLLLVVFAASPAFAVPTRDQIADACSETCTFDLCLSEDGKRLVDCADPCTSNLRVRMRAFTPKNSRHRGEPIVRVGAARLRLECHGTAIACFTCRSDADCDDGNPVTRDICLDDVLPSGPRCEHLCARH
jgi:hypothetical protein